MNSIMRKELYKRCIIHKVASQIFNKPCYISGQSIGPLYCDNDKAIIKDSLEYIKTITFRDKNHSIRIVRDELGLENVEMYDAGDDAFTLKPVDKTIAEKLIMSEVQDFGKDLNPSVAMNIKASLNAFKGAGRSSDLGREIEILALTADYLVERYNAKIIFIPTDYCRGVDDRIEHRRIITKIKESNQKNVFALEKIYSDKELKGIISCFDIAIGVRYHFSVFSLAEAVPTIGIASGEYQMAKLRGVYGLLDVSEYFIDEDMETLNFQILKEKIDLLLQKKEEIVKKLKTNSRTIEKSSKLIVEKILKNMEIK